MIRLKNNGFKQLTGDQVNGVSVQDILHGKPVILFDSGFTVGGCQGLMNRPDGDATLLAGIQYFIQVPGRASVL